MRRLKNRTDFRLKNRTDFRLKNRTDFRSISKQIPSWTAKCYCAIVLLRYNTNKCFCYPFLTDIIIVIVIGQLSAIVLLRYRNSSAAIGRTLPKRLRTQHNKPYLLALQRPGWRSYVTRTNYLKLHHILLHYIILQNDVTIKLTQKLTLTAINLFFYFFLFCSLFFFLFVFSCFLSLLFFLYFVIFVFLLFLSFFFICFYLFVFPFVCFSFFFSLFIISFVFFNYFVICFSFIFFCSLFVFLSFFMFILIFI
jgi:hypothetical protein